MLPPHGQHDGGGDAYVTSGIGYEVDYNVYDSNEYAYSSFHWKVENGRIYIYYDDYTWNNATIRDYSIDYNHFYGWMYDTDNREYKFDLENVGSWNWDRYRTRANTRGEADSDSLYVSGNGASVATGRFAEALKKIAK